MAPNFSFGKIEITADTKQPSSHGMPEPEVPFYIALLGDFSNHAASKASERLADLRPVLIDRDNFDDVLAHFGIELELPAGIASKGTAKLRIAKLEDFHPDRIFAQVESFRMLDDLRKRLSNPVTFASAAAEMQGLISREPATERTARQPDSAPDHSQLSSDKLLDQIIDASPGQMGEVKPAEVLDDWQSYLRRLVAPHLVSQASPHEPELVAHLEAVMSKQMRVILHEPEFQAVEAAWRSVYFLTHRLQTGSHLRVYLLDISKAELAADLNSSEELNSSATYRLLAKPLAEAADSQPWALLAGNYTFDHSRDDAELLGRIAKIAAQMRTPFIAPASPHILGCDSLASTPDPDDWLESSDAQAIEAWNALRQLPEASYLGLALPGFLLRLPYGRETEPIEQFAFEEVEQIPSHDDYLWGNPAFACVYLLAEAFTQAGWNLRPGAFREIEKLPLHVYEKDGEPVLKPCAEALLSERAAERILEHGLMPLLSLQGSDVIRLARFQSLSKPLKPLAARWSG